MANGMTKKQCKQFEDMVTKYLTDVLGKPEPWLDTGLEWKMPYGDGEVTFHLIADSHEVGNTYRNSWLACRVRNDAFVGSDGYKLPQRDIPGGWPSYFTYPSGKFNLMPDDGASKAEMQNEIVMHLYKVSEPDSEYQKAFGSINFETDEPELSGPKM